MFQDATNVGVEYQLTPTTAIGVNYVHNKLTRAIEDVGSLDATGNEIYFAANPGEGVAATRTLRTGLTAAVRDAEAAAAVRRARSDDQPPLLEQLVRQRQPDDQPAVWQLRRSGELRRDPDAHDGHLVGDRAAAGGQHRPARHCGRARVGPRRARMGLARQPGRPGTARDRSSGRGEVLRRLQAAVRHAGRRVRLRRQRHADEHRGEHDQHHSRLRQRARRHGPHAARSHAPICSSRTR